MARLRVAVPFISLFVAAAGAAVACGGESTAPRSPSEPTASTSALLVLVNGADSGKVDKVGVGDGALKPDGVKDLSFLLTVDGPIKALFLVAVDAAGASNGQYEADTLVGDEEVPKAISTKWGRNTEGLGVAEQDALINAPNGSVSLPAARRQLALFISPPAALTKGARLRAYVQRPDGSVDASNILNVYSTRDAGG